MLKLFFILLILVFSFSSFQVSAAEPIYKSVDQYGNTVFSDQGSASSKEVKLQETSTFDSTRLLEEFSKGSTSRQSGPGNGKFRYKTLKVTSTTNEEAVRANNGDLEILVIVDPHKQQGHTIELLMDGKTHSTISGTTSVALENIDRGTHLFKLQVIDTDSQRIVQTGPETLISVLRHSVPGPSHY
ncbi:MAG: DUF4124 domain-containing protein [Pseudomonadales bacterium]